MGVRRCVPKVNDGGEVMLEAEDGLPLDEIVVVVGVGSVICRLGEWSLGACSRDRSGGFAALDGGAEDAKGVLLSVVEGEDDVRVVG